MRRYIAVVMLFLKDGKGFQHCRVRWWSCDNASSLSNRRSSHTHAVHLDNYSKPNCYIDFVRQNTYIVNISFVNLHPFVLSLNKVIHLIKVMHCIEFRIYQLDEDFNILQIWQWHQGLFFFCWLERNSSWWCW